MHMNGSVGNLSFGELIQALRREKKWTVKDFIEKIQVKGYKSISPAYVTRIEVHGEIPSPELICIIADLFGYDEETLLTHAKKIKLQRFDRALKQKYEKAAGLYRAQKTGGA